MKKTAMVPYLISAFAIVTLGQNCSSRNFESQELSSTHLTAAEKVPTGNETVQKASEEIGLAIKDFFELQMPVPGSDEERVILLNPLIFRADYYRQMNPDVAQYYKDDAGAASHWLKNGYREGRQAHPNFSSREYVVDFYNRYKSSFTPFLRNLNANDFGQLNKNDINNLMIRSIKQYVTSGFRSGFNGNPNQTLVFSNLSSLPAGQASNDKVFVGVSLRTAGAVHSLRWNGKEFINDWDHGRQLQIALTFGGYGECLNPTEAGSSNDSTGYATTSKLINYGVNPGTPNIFNSSVQPAYWMAPNATHPSGSCTSEKSPVAVNKTKVGNDFISKTIVVGIDGFPRGIEYTTNLLVSADHNSRDLQLLTVEAPTGYLNGEFTDWSVYDTDLKTWAKSPLKQIDPLSTQAFNFVNKHVVMSDLSGKYAMGVVSLDTRPKAISLSYFPSSFGNTFDSTNKWSVSFALNNVLAKSSLTFKTYVFVGTKAQVQSDVVSFVNKRLPTVTDKCLKNETSVISFYNKKVVCQNGFRFITTESP